MRKLTSILLLGILLFNWVGFRVVSAFLQARSSAALIADLDHDQYQESDLVSVKIPSSLPYYVGSGQFERVDGEIELNDMHYNYVKRRVVQDSIEYLCIPNKQKTALKQASDEFYKLVNDIRHNTPAKKDNNSGIVKMLTTDCDRFTQDFSFSAFRRTLGLRPCYQQPSCPSFTIAPVELPPNV